MKLFFYLIVLALLLPTVVLAELPEVVQSDLSVIDGTVIMEINDEYIVDLDGNDNLKIGDILTVVSEGKKIIHPKTKAVIGTITDPLGFMKVTRINSGYSYAKVITEGFKPADGAPLKRFEQVPAVCNAPEGSDELVRYLKANLPQFKWLEESVAEQALLTFVLQEDRLDVMAQDGLSLHQYQVAEGQLLVKKTAYTSRPTVNLPTQQDSRKPLQKLADALVGGLGGKTNQERFAEMDAAIIRQKNNTRTGIWLGPTITGSPVGLVVADLDNDGQQEIAMVLDDDTLLISRVIDGNYVELAKIEIPQLLDTYSLDVFDGDQDGRPELYLTALEEYRMASMVVEFTGDDYEVVIDDVRWFLRVVELPERGPTLVGQRMGDDVRTFEGQPFIVHREKDRLVKGEEFSLPKLANIFSVMPFVDQEGKLLYAYITKDDHLKVVNAEGTDLWESEGYYGGSESCFNNREELENGDTVIPTCLPPRLLKTDNNELLVVQNEGQRLMQRYRKFKKGRLVSMSWNGFALDEVWSTASQQGYLGDFSRTDADNDGNPELVMGVKFQHKGAIQDARSSIVMFDME